MAEDRYAPLMEEVVVTGRRGGRRADPRYYVPEIPEDKIGIDTRSVAGQIKSSLWDVFSKNVTEYLSGNKFSQDTLKNIIKQQSLRVPVDLPGDYGIDFDINRRAYDRTIAGHGADPGMGVSDAFRVTLKKEF